MGSRDRRRISSARVVLFILSRARAPAIRPNLPARGNDAVTCLRMSRASCSPSTSGTSGCLPATGGTGTSRLRDAVRRALSPAALRADLLVFRAETTAAATARSATVTITKLDRRQLLGRGGKVTGALGSIVSSARERSAPLWNRRSGNFSRQRFTAAARGPGTEGGSGSGCAFRVA